MLNFTQSQLKQISKQQHDSESLFSLYSTYIYVSDQYVILVTGFF